MLHVRSTILTLVPAKLYDFCLHSSSVKNRKIHQLMSDITCTVFLCFVVFLFVSVFL